MSRNPYLAASRPSASYTRSSRSSGRSGATSGGLLGRSRSSATLGSFASHYNPATGKTYTGLAGYIPAWQRSSSTNRAESGAETKAPLSSSKRPSKDQDQADDEQEIRRTTLNENNLSLYRSASSHNLNNKSPSSTRDDDETNDHLKNYQQSKLQQTNPVTSKSNNRSSLQSLDSNLNSASLDDLTTSRRSTLSLESSDNEPIGDSIPSASARHLKSQSQLIKSKSVELGAGEQRSAAAESTMLYGSMSVDRLLLRAESMGERDLRKSFKELVMENERLKQQLKGSDDKEKQKQQDWIRKERQLERKISELEEENKQIEHWKQEIQRLKEENNSLIRVVSKLSKR